MSVRPYTSSLKRASLVWVILAGHCVLLCIQGCSRSTGSLRVDAETPLRAIIHGVREGDKLVLHCRLEGKLDVADVEKKEWMMYMYTEALSPNVSCSRRSGGSISWESGRLLGAGGSHGDVLGGCSPERVQKFINERGVVIVTVVVVEVVQDVSGSRTGETARIIASKMMHLSDFVTALE